MSAAQAWALGRTFLAVTFILGFMNVDITATIITGAIALTLLWKAETR